MPALSGPRTPCQALAGFALLCLAQTSPAAPTVAAPPTGLGPAQLGVVINDADPLSRAIGARYLERRGIPPQNALHVRFAPGGKVMTPREFEAVKAAVDAQAGEGIQALALTWLAPYRVGCMSITSAFAFGFDRAYCAAGCAPTRRSPYFDHPTWRPWRALGIRPTMMLAAPDLEAATALIERGIAADGTRPPGGAYLLSTSDRVRNVRAASYPQARDLLDGILEVHVLEQDVLQGRDDVLFYFTGSARVEGLEDLGFLPGALADHLTSKGGQVLGSDQMSSLRWLAAGATASYGAVVEPCNFPQKFPHPAVAMAHYVSGATAIEAYWKSVAQPGQGLFIGEPLARPWGGMTVTAQGDTVVVEGAALPGLYLLLQHIEGGPFRLVATRWSARPGPLRWRFPGLDEAAYELVRVRPPGGVIPQ